MAKVLKTLFLPQVNHLCLWHRKLPRSTHTSRVAPSTIHYKHRYRDFPAGPVFKESHLQCRRHWPENWSIPGQGTNTPHAREHAQAPGFNYWATCPRTHGGWSRNPPQWEAWAAQWEKGCTAMKLSTCRRNKLNNEKIHARGLYLIKIASLTLCDLLPQKQTNKRKT